MYPIHLIPYQETTTRVTPAQETWYGTDTCMAKAPASPNEAQSIS